LIAFVLKLGDSLYIWAFSVVPKFLLFFFPILSSSKFTSKSKSQFVCQERTMVNGQERILDIYLHEYAQLKQEQNQRISLRDNLLYFTLGVYVAILGFALGKQGDPYALLVLPWVSIILGWTYLVNDQKISAIGQYIRYQLATKISEIISNPDADTKSVLGWEIAHRSDTHRKRRKAEQLIIDQFAFVLSGLVALLAFRFLQTTQLAGSAAPTLSSLVQPLWWVEVVLLLGLGIEILLQADWNKGR
jgi:hypothetical protein